MRCTGEFVPRLWERVRLGRMIKKDGHSAWWYQKGQYYACSNCDQRWVRAVTPSGVQFEQLSLTEYVRREAQLQSKVRASA